MIPEVSDNCAYALAYASCGYDVFPLVPGTKFPFKGSHGELDGTRDEDTIRSWWRMSPGAGIACALRFTPFFVVDIDARSAGHLWWDAMVGADSSPTSLICESGSGWPSAHYWFRMSPRLQGYHCKQVPHAPGVDIKGLPYGYVAMPPTKHSSGGVYSWWDECHPTITEPPLPPRWLEDAILLGSKPLAMGRNPLDMPLDMGLDFPRARELMAEGWQIGRQIGPGRWIMKCPNASEHSEKKMRGENDSSTVLMAPLRHGGWGRIFCSHAHCEHIK